MSEVLLVHCVDTEGPLYESIPATFERVRSTFGLDLPPSEEQLERLQAGLDVPEDLRDRVMDFVSAERLHYNRSWTEVDAMLGTLMQREWRMKYRDDFDGGYVFSWFVLDHVGHVTNPRQRALGFHAVYEHYKDMLNSHRPDGDALYWHFHPVAFSREANRSSCNYSFTNLHIESISRRLIDHLDFPVAFRPGLHCERPDINLFLEMWIPVDFGNQGMPERAEDAHQKDLSGGRFGDWRRASAEWGVYHPDWYDYQKPGAMKRYIARSLNLNARVRPITRAEVVRAFERAKQGQTAILAVVSHDQNDIRGAVSSYMAMVHDVRREFPGVAIRHANAVDAVRRAEKMTACAPARLKFSWSGNKLDIHADKAIWGPQPWFCFKTADQRYLHENLDRQGETRWSFVFDADSIPLERLDCIGLATNDEAFHSSVYRIPILGGRPGSVEERYLNLFP